MKEKKKQGTESHTVPPETQTAIGNVGISTEDIVNSGKIAKAWDVPRDTPNIVNIGREIQKDVKDQGLANIYITNNTGSMSMRLLPATIRNPHLTILICRRTPCIEMKKMISIKMKVSLVIHVKLPLITVDPCTDTEGHMHTTRKLMKRTMSAGQMRGRRCSHVSYASQHSPNRNL